MSRYFHNTRAGCFLATEDVWMTSSDIIICAGSEEWCLKGLHVFCLNQSSEGVRTFSSLRNKIPHVYPMVSICVQAVAAL